MNLCDCMWMGEHECVWLCVFEGKGQRQIKRHSLGTVRLWDCLPSAGNPGSCAGRERALFWLLQSSSSPSEGRDCCFQTACTLLPRGGPGSPSLKRRHFLHHHWSKRSHGCPPPWPKSMPSLETSVSTGEESQGLENQSRAFPLTVRETRWTTAVAFPDLVAPPLLCTYTESKTLTAARK